MAITFPNSPSSGDTHTTSNGLQYTYDGEKWTTIGTNSAGTWTRSGTTVSLTTAGDDLNVDSGTLFVDASTNNVGIGTSSPSVLLELKSTEPYIQFTDTAAASGYSRIMATHQGALVLSADESNSVGSSHLRFDVDATERMRIDSSGRVGIGTSSPSAPLHINGSANNTAITLSVGGTVTGYVGPTGYLNGGSDSDLGYRVESGNNHIFMTGAVERLRIDSSGKLLVGATSSLAVGSSAASDLQIVGTLGYQSLSRYSANGAGPNLILGKSRNASLGSHTIVQNNDDLGNITFAGDDGTDLQTVAARIVCEVDSTPSANNMPGRLVFSTTADGSSSPSERLRINSDGTTTFTSDATINSLTVGRGSGDLSTNTAVGNDALNANTSGANNVATGSFALLQNTTGSSNTACGRSALDSNTTGNNNTATGRDALVLNTTGSNNTANGYDCLRSNTTGNYNTATGINALRTNTTGDENVAIGKDALRSNTTGSFNVASGESALYNNTTGGNNVAVGRQALLSNTTGGQNTASGTNSLRQNTTGSSNTAAGYDCLRSNTTGANNVASGADALRSNTTGTQNAAFGVNALLSNSTGSYNSATGFQSLKSNTTGNNNTANGYFALDSNTTGSSNTASGYQALYSNTTANQNVATGVQALFSNTTGAYNVALGNAALYNLTTGSGNTGIGLKNSSGTYSPVFNPTTENNRLVLGHTSITNAYVQVAWTVTSDERDKMNFAPVPYGLDFVNQLKPTAYQFKVDRDTETPNGDVRYGFKAQDILALEGDNPVIIDTEDADHLKYKGEHLVPVLVNAVQELSTMVKELQAEIKTLKG